MIDRGGASYGPAIVRTGLYAGTQSSPEITLRMRQTGRRLAAAVMATIVVVAVVPVATMIVPVIAVVFPTIAVMFLVTRDVLAVVPVVLHKEDPFAAGVVFAAVIAPMFGVARRYA